MRTACTLGELGFEYRPALALGGHKIVGEVAIAGAAVLARHQRRTRSHADRIAADRGLEAHAFCGEAVDIGSADNIVAVAVDFESTQLVTETDDDIARCTAGCRAEY